MFLLTKIYQVISNIKYSAILKSWIYKGGDSNLRLDYNLSNDSLVLDIGGYLGDWASLIYKKYKCKIFVFEPVKSYFKKITARFEKIPKIQVYNFGLGTEDIKQYISIMDNSSSFYKVNDEAKKELCEIIDIERFILEKNLNHIDLIKINIEGGEFDLLDKIIKKKLISRFENLQIQFHRFIPKAFSRRKKIQRQLSKTHYLTYNYPFVWENWQKR